MLDLHWRAQPLGQSLFQTHNVRITLGRAFVVFFLAQPLANQGFGLAYGQTACDNVPRTFNLPFARQSQQRTGMSHFQIAMRQ